MAAGRFNYLAKAQADEVYGAVAFAAPTNIAFKLSTAAFDRTKTGTTIAEANYTSYAPVVQTNNTTNFPAGSSGAGGYTIGGNANAVTFPQNTGTAETELSAATSDNSARVTGNLLHGADITSTVINANDTPKINASGFSDVES